MKIILNKILPESVAASLRRFRFSRRMRAESIRDAGRYVAHSRSIDELTYEKLRAAIIAHYHVLEKGLAMPHRKSSFGQSVARSLIGKLHTWNARGYRDDRQILSAHSVLAAYAEALDEAAKHTIPELERFVAWQAERAANCGGIRRVKKQDFLFAARGDYSQLVKVRRSIRDYADIDVPENVIRSAIVMAQNSPSVCNRQSCGAFWTTDRQKIDAILHLQSGNRGFGHLAKGLLIITSNLNVFHETIERNQAWVDGGLFSMSLLYALTYQGLGACPLNWCTDEDRDQRLRSLTNIPDNHQIIMLISLGYLNNEFDVAYSERNDVSDVMWKIE